MPKFCHHCGKQTVVGANFCQVCGTNLSSLAAGPTPQPIVQPQSTFTPFSPTSDDDDDEYIDRIQKLDIRMNGLQLEIKKDQPIGETMGSVMAQGGNAPAAPIVPPPNLPTVDGKAFLETFKQEAGAKRPNERTRSNAIEAN